MSNDLDAISRKEIFRRILPYLCKDVPASFLQKTEFALPGIVRLHNLIEGIYKPAEARYALSIASMLKNPYADRLQHNSNRSWFFDYSPKDGSLDSAVNKSLFYCMMDKEPVLVLKQLSDKTSTQGTRYRILGLGLLQSFEPKSRIFKIRGLQIEEIHEYLGMGSTVMEDDLIDTAIELEALEGWSPFEDKNRILYRVDAQVRDRHFRRIVLRNYDSTCSVTGQRFELNGLVEVQAVHIISKHEQGTDNPKNGLAMSRSVHWAFDAGIFTITDQFEIKINPKAKLAKVQNFPLFEMEKKQIQLPKESLFHPHPEALRWHFNNVYKSFGS
jgi:hypothetical protein